MDSTLGAASNGGALMRIAGWGWRITRIALRTAVALTFAGIVLVFAIWLWWQRDPSDDQRSRGVNALWAEHSWVGDRHTEAEYRAFAEFLREHEISDVFFHAGPFDERGEVPDDLIRHARPLLAAMERHAPEVRAQAYLGQIEARGGGVLDLDEPAVRDGIIETADAMLDLGFEGIHYDIEPIHPGDGRFLELLARTRKLTERRGAVLSVAVEQIEPVPGAQRVLSKVIGGYHDPSDDFLRDVAERVDQVAIMTYDSAMPADWLFGAHVAWQTERVVRTIGEDVTVFMGVPTYDGETRPRYYSWAENVHSGIRGVRKGLDQLERDRTRDVGIAIFAEWTTDDDEWAAYREDWLRE